MKKIVIICLYCLVCFNLLADTTFLAHYNGNTGNYGFDADHAVGSGTASTDSIYWPSLSTIAKYGGGSLALPWWSGKSLVYSAIENYDNQCSTVEFFVDTSAMFDSSTHLFDGHRRYIFYDDLAWGASGNVDVWFDGEIGSKTARLVAIIHGDRDGQPVEITMMGPAGLPFTSRFVHYAIEWDSKTGKASVYYQGFLASRLEAEPWCMSNVPDEFFIGMSSNQVGEILLDDLKISNGLVYDNLSEVSERVFDLPIREAQIPGEQKTLFLAHYNGNTANGGLDADYAYGSVMVTIPDPNYGVPTINASCLKFGAGAVEMPWWSQRSMVYQAQDNYDNSYATIDFQINLMNSYIYNGADYVFDGVRRYIFNDDIAWGDSGHVDIWVSGVAGEPFVRIYAHIFNADNECITLVGPEIGFDSGGNIFQHYALQWDSLRGIAALYKDGNLESRVFTSSWMPINMPNVFKLGMQSSLNTPKLILDEFRISRTSCYDFGVNLGELAFELPTDEYIIENW